MTARRWPISAFAAFEFYIVLAGDSLRYSITWWGWGAVVTVCVAISVVLLVRLRSRWSVNQLPYPLIAFLVITVASVAWSNYPLWSATAVLANLMTVAAGVTLAIALTREELLWALGTALRFALGLSLLFELVVALLVRKPILPWWEHFTGKVPAAYYWSRDLLFTGKQIQGIMGNSNLLGFVALLALIVFANQLASGSVRRFWGLFWIVVALACIALTRSATVTIALGVVLVVAVILVVVRMQRGTRGRLVVAILGTIFVIGAIALGYIFKSKVLELLGKSGTLTGRTGIWNSVIYFAKQRPVQGWGWATYWNPESYPFTSRRFELGHVHYYQAHDAWLDVWLQIGIIGLVVFIAFVLSTAVRTWILAVDRTGVVFGQRGPRDPISLLPVLIVIALVAQSFTESRLLIEYGMLLMTLFAVRSKRELTEPTGT
jgi:exopolysaccharide production protein ExoQ